MNGIPTIGAVMTPLPRAIDVDTPIREARKLMRERGVRHLPVCKNGELVALLSDRDIKRALDPSLGLPSANELFATNIAVFDPHTVTETTPLDVALSQMADLHIGSILIERDGDLLGIFTSTDAARLFAQYLQTAPVTEVR